MRRAKILTVSYYCHLTLGRLSSSMFHEESAAPHLNIMYNNYIFPPLAPQVFQMSAQQSIKFCFTAYTLRKHSPFYPFARVFHQGFNVQHQSTHFNSISLQLTGPKTYTALHYRALLTNHTLGQFFASTNTIPLSHPVFTLTLPYTQTNIHPSHHLLVTRSSYSLCVFTALFLTFATIVSNTSHLMFLRILRISLATKSTF